MKTNSLLRFGRGLPRSWGVALVLLATPLAIADPSATGEGDTAALFERARTHCASGAYAPALALLESAVARLDAAGRQPEAAAALGLTARVHRRMGDARTAVAQGRDALRRLEGSGDLQLHVELSIDLAAAYVDLLEEDAALVVLDDAMARCAASPRAGHRPRLHVAMGDAHRSLEEYDEARACYERALSDAKAAGDDASRGDAFLGIGKTLRVLGETRAATTYYERALALFAGSDRSRAAVEALVELGRTQREAGDLDGALAYYDRARQAAEAARHGDLHATCLWACAHTNLARGEGGEAARAASRAIRALPSLFGGLSEEQGAVARARHGGLFEVGARAAMSLGNDELLCFFLESGRAGMLLEFLGARDALQAVLVAPELLAVEREARAREAAALSAYREVMDGAGRRRLRRARAALDAAREELKVILERIQRETRAKVGAVVPPPAPLARLQSWLRPDEALVLYGVFPEEAVALVLRHDGRRRVSLGATREIERAYHAVWLDDADRDTAAAFERLRGLLVEPLRLEDDVRRVLVSPDGIVAYVPFAPIVGDREVVCIPSGTTYGILREERSRRGEGVLALGDPLYDTKVDPCLTASVRSGVTLAPLPFTRDEAEAVGDVVLLGSEATEAGFRFSVSKRPRWRSVHLACHGVVDPDRPTLSALALTATEADDGFLTALDVFRLRIPADLVVLSACDSGVGKIVNAEGVLGLMRAFTFAGAPRVVVSLGRVSDTATRAFMEVFYGHLAQDLPAATALRRAQDHVRAQPEWSHPHYWASWVLWGLPD